MSKSPSVVAGVELCQKAVKTVVLQLKKERLALTHYAVLQFDAGNSLSKNPGALGSQLSAAVGSSPKAFSVALMDSAAVLKIIEQPETPREVLRKMLRLNGESLLNQDVRNHITDCALVSGAMQGRAGKRKYLAAALPRVRVAMIAEGFRKLPLGSIQLSPVCIWNAFEFAKPDIFKNKTFMLLDMGHEISSLIIGSRGELLLIRTIDYGSNQLLHSLVNVAGCSEKEALHALQNQEALLLQTAKNSIQGLVREVMGSISFFEGNNDQNINQIYISGGMGKSGELIALLSQAVSTPCEVWSPFENCEIALSSLAAASFPQHAMDLHVAYGAAVQLLGAES